MLKIVFKKKWNSCLKVLNMSRKFGISANRKIGQIRKNGISAKKFWVKTVNQFTGDKEKQHLDDLM